jgi:drug/metabolite transporter (DMT)-like permease
MERRVRWYVLLAAVGSVLIACATLLQYIHAHRTGQPAGYVPLALGALAAGLLVAMCSRLAARRSTAIVIALIGVLASLAFAAILVVTLIWGFIS